MCCCSQFCSLFNRYYQQKEVLSSILPHIISTLCCICISISIPYNEWILQKVSSFVPGRRLSFRNEQKQMSTDELFRSIDRQHKHVCVRPITAQACDVCGKSAIVMKGGSCLTYMWCKQLSSVPLASLQQCRYN